MGRAALFAIVFFGLACGSSGSGGSGLVTPPPPDGGNDAGPDAGPDGGNPDAGPVDAGPLGGGDWGQYRHDPLGRSENPGVFEAAEIANLGPLWQRDDLGPQMYTQAVAAEGIVVYTTAFSGRVVAVDASTGVPRWPDGGRTLNSPIVTNCEGRKQPGFWSSAAIANGVVYAASPDGNVYALRASNGTTIWQTQPRVADPTAAANGEFIQSSPAVSTRLGRLYVGVASSAGKACEVAGRIVAIDLASGAVVRSQRLVDPGKQGAAVWSSITIVEDENRIYATTGNREGPANATPYAQAFLALDPETLEVLDHWQNPSDVEDVDFGSSPTPFDAGGMKLIAATSKDGNLYVLRRDALNQGPVWTYRMAQIDPGNPRVGVDPIRGWGSISTPAFAHGVLYAGGGKTPDGTAPGSVVAFDPATGKVLHAHNTPGYVLGPLAVAGEILVVESTALDNSQSWLEVLKASDLTPLRRFDANAPTFAGPSIANGAIFWTDASGITHNFGVPKYRR